MNRRLLWAALAAFFITCAPAHAYEGKSPVPLNQGGTSSNLTDPNADRIFFWDDSAGETDWLSLSGLSISGTTLSISDSELSCLAGLTSAADKLPYFTGSGTCAVTDFTSAARSILDDASVGAIATTLGLGTGDSPQFAAVNLNHATANTLTASGGHMTIEGATVWDSGNDGSGSTLDADLLDGISSAGFQAADTTLDSFAALSISQGDVIYGDGSNSVARLAKDTNSTRFLSNTGTSNNPAWAQITSSGLNITTTSCTNQFVTAISAAAAGTCTTATLASAQFANQGTTTTVLHGNAAGNPSFAAVSISADVSGLGSNVATFLGTPSSANLSSALTDEAFSMSDVELGAVAGLTSAADKFPYFTGSGTAALADLSSSMRTFLTTSSMANLGTLLTDEASGWITFGTTPTAANFASLVTDDAFSIADVELGAIAGLTSAADKIPYFTGSGTAAVTDFTSTARSIVDDTSVGAVRTTIGVGTGDSPQFAAVNVTDATATTLTGSAGHLTVEGSTVWDSGNDGSGSGLDADTLDGTSSAGFQAADADLTTLASAFSTASASAAAWLDLAEDTDNGTNRVRLSGAQSTADVTVTLPAATTTLIGTDTTDTLTNKSIAAGQITAGTLNIGNNAATIGTLELANGTANTVSGSGGHLAVEGNTVWDSGNDGASSTLDADLLDGKNTGTSGNVVGLLDGANTISATWTMRKIDPAADDTYDLGTSDTTRWSNVYVHDGVHIDDNGVLRLYETEANGDNYVEFVAPAALGSNRQCVLQDSGPPIPDSCVGDGSDAGGGAGVSDADYGDITVSGSGTVFDVDDDITVAQTDAGATGVLWTFHHDSASPAADDIPLDIQVKAGADDEEIGRIAYHLIDGATTTEDGDWRFYVDVAGTSAVQASIGNGVIIGAGTTFPGAGNLSFPEGGAINWDAGDCILTQTGNSLDTTGCTISFASLAGVQALDATLTALAAYNTNGILVQTAADTFAGRTLTGTTNEITVTNGNGVSGNPTVSLPSAVKGNTFLAAYALIGGL
jgi:hypothetical protein